MDIKEFEEKQKAELEEFLKSQKAKYDENKKLEEVKAKEKSEYEQFVETSLNMIMSEYGFNKKQAELILEEAWQEAHSWGYSDVKNRIIDFCDLFKEVVEAK